MFTCEAFTAEATALEDSGLALPENVRALKDLGWAFAGEAKASEDLAATLQRNVGASENACRAFAGKAWASEDVAVALWKKAAASLRTSGYGAIDVRLLTDLAGAPFYTVVLESTFNSVAEWEKAHLAARDNAPWKALYGKIVAFTESDHREILSIIA